MKKRTVTRIVQYVSAAVIGLGIVASVIAAWVGTEVRTADRSKFDYFSGMTVTDSDGKVTGGALLNWSVLDSSDPDNPVYYVNIDVYAAKGFTYETVSASEYDAISEYQEQTGKQLMYPLVDRSRIAVNGAENDANLWFAHTSDGRAIYNADGSFTPIYLTDSDGGYVYYEQCEEGYVIRVRWLDYYEYLHSGRAPGVFSVIGSSRLYAVASDGCFAAFAVLGGIGLLSVAAAGGTFDMLVYGVRSLLTVFRSGRKEQYIEKDFYEYRKVRAGKRVSFWFLVITGAVFFLLALVFTMLYRSAL